LINSLENFLKTISRWCANYYRTKQIL